MAANNNNSNSKIWQDAVSATQDCPGIEVLERVMEGTAQDPRTQNHVSTCPHCQSELALLRKFENAEASPDEGAAVAWITAQLERKQTGEASQPVRQAMPFWRSLFRVPYMAAAAAVIVAATLGISLYVSEDFKKPNFDHNIGIGTPLRSGEIRLTNPLGDLAAAPDQLKWEAVAGASTYSVVITAMDIDHTVIWQGQANQNGLTVGPDLRSKIRPGKPLTWKVTALDSTGKEIATGEGRFRLALTPRTQP
jgi:hypothetical protein